MVRGATRRAARGAASTARISSVDIDVDLAGGDMTEVALARLGLDSSTNSYVVILREVGGRRLLPIWIGQPEAESIVLQINGVKRERPLTHDLCKALIVSLGGDLERVEITKVKNSTYFAELHIRTAAGLTVVDARPSDSIAIALRLDVPLFAADELLTIVDEEDDDDDDDDGPSFGPPSPMLLPTPRGEMTPEQLKAYLEQLRPEDFGKFTP
jgi:bifunctional DNase/RNase